MRSRTFMNVNVGVPVGQCGKAMFLAKAQGTAKESGESAGIQRKGKRERQGIHGRVRRKFLSVLQASSSHNRRALSTSLSGPAASTPARPVILFLGMAMTLSTIKEVDNALR